MNLKQIAAEKAVEHVTSNMKLGLGTGSTVQFVLEALAERLRSGSIRDIVGVPTSKATEQQSNILGIPLTTLEECPHLDLTIDGADEVSPELQLIKGLGGALLREKIVAEASTRLFIVADDSKCVEQLGTRAPLPVEVLPLGWNTNLPLFERLGAQPNLRMTKDGQRYVTDNGNYIVDCTFPQGIQDPHAIARQLDAQGGVLGHGLFLDRASVAFIASAEGVVMLERKPS